MPFKFTPLEINGLVLVEPKVFGDRRGFFMETYRHSDFSEEGISEHFVQDNHSRSGKGVLRGLHYQTGPMEQGKLVRCLSGSVFDVAVDIRPGSPTFSKWLSLELTEDNNRMLYIPPGFAHGFLVLSDTADVLYKCTVEYSPAHERGVLWSDPDLAIEWPMDSPLLSEKDSLLPLLKDSVIQG